MFNRWGRVGVTGDTNFKRFSYNDGLKKFKQQSGAKKRKGYTEIKIASSAGGEKGGDTKAVIALKQEKVKDSVLSAGLQTLIKFFFDKSLMEASIVSVNVDVKKMPLGQLSKETVL